MSIAGLFCSFNIFSNKVTFSLSVPTNQFLYQAVSKKIVEWFAWQNKKFPQRAKTFFILLRARIYSRIFGGKELSVRSKGKPGQG